MITKNQAHPNVLIKHFEILIQISCKLFELINKQIYASSLKIQLKEFCGNNFKIYNAFKAVIFIKSNTVRLVFALQINYGSIKRHQSLQSQILQKQTNFNKAQKTE
jgi:hypothetical protein